MAISLPQRVPENVPGDFYVVAGLCLACCLPHDEAPDLLNDPKLPFKECYFRRQPSTSEEVVQAINAICVSDICGLRYGGADPAIIGALRARQAAQQCDQTDEGQASLISIAKASEHRTHGRQDETPARSPVPDRTIGGLTSGSHRLMKKRMSKWLSPPFICLYVAAIAAVVLNGGRHQWGSAGWFPVAVGSVAALAIISLRSLLEKSLLNFAAGNGRRIILFFACAIFPCAALPVLGREDKLLICGVVSMSLLFFYAAFGTIFQWPGFGQPLEPRECNECGSPLSDNASGDCPERGAPIDVPSTKEG